MSKDCNFQNVTAIDYRNEAIRDSFISGLHDSNIRKRLLENETLTLQTAFDKARALDLTQKNSEFYTSGASSALTAAINTEIEQPDSDNKTTAAAVAASTLSGKSKKCYFCGYNYHARTNCPAKESVCYKCNKVGHFSRMCRSKNINKKSTNLVISSYTHS